jgi:hypothetical protein
MFDRYRERFAQALMQRRAAMNPYMQGAGQQGQMPQGMPQQRAPMPAQGGGPPMQQLPPRPMPMRREGPPMQFAPPQPQGPRGPAAGLMDEEDPRIRGY